jgi:ABC-2 type transport system ATP-binding protein
LCDRLAIIDKGKVLACDTPANLKRRVQQHPLFEISMTPGANGPLNLDAIAGVHQATETAGPTAVDLKLSLAEDAVIGAVVQRIVESGSRIVSLKKVEPTLEDVFIELVGHGFAADNSEAT